MSKTKCVVCWEDEANLEKIGTEWLCSQCADRDYLNSQMCGDCLVPLNECAHAGEYARASK